jgi:2-polyprenyl-6-methoxyphenol hydroxylase-like FAD-dependent oxidoreductase
MKTIIIGAGVAGPALGTFLRRLGYEVDLYEARGEDEGDGAFLGLAPNGLNVFAELGLAARVRAEGIESKGFRFFNARGQPIGAIDGTQDEARFGAPLVIARRGALQRATLDVAIAAGVRVHFGHRLAALDQGPGVTARFENGLEARGDLLIGCDGLRSRTRALALPKSPEPKFVGQLSFGGSGRVDAPELEVGLNVMVFGQRAFFGATRAKDGEVWWFHNDGDADPRRALTDTEARQRILDQHADDPAWISALVKSSPRLLGPWALHDIVSLPRWHSGRVCLIGDAAHATTPNAGQGASLALEDAMVLAKCLRDEPTVEAAFAKLEAIRKPRVEPIVKASRRIGSTKVSTNPVGLWLRDRLMPTFLKFGAKAQAAEYGHRIDW